MNGKSATTLCRAWGRGTRRPPRRFLRRVDELRSVLLEVFLQPLQVLRARREADVMLVFFFPSLAYSFCNSRGWWRGHGFKRQSFAGQGRAEGHGPQRLRRLRR